MHARDGFFRSGRPLRRLGFVVEGYARDYPLITELCASSHGARLFGVVQSGKAGFGERHAAIGERGQH